MPEESLMARRIRECREEAGLTQEELASQLGMQRAAINKYEKGYVENMKRATIQKMAKIFGVSPAWLMGFDEEEINESNEDNIPRTKEGLMKYFFENPELNVLFSIAGDLDSESIEFLIKLAKTLKKGD